jgi:hypothetical protein
MWLRCAAVRLGGQIFALALDRNIAQNGKMNSLKYKSAEPILLIPQSDLVGSSCRSLLLGDL